MYINRQFFFGVVVGSIISLTFWATLLSGYNAPKIVQVIENSKPFDNEENIKIPISVNSVPTSAQSTPTAQPIEDNNIIEPPEFPVTLDDVLFMVFTGTGRAEREDWGYRTWLKRLPEDSLVFYSDFDCEKVKCINVGGAEQGRAMKNKVIAAFKHAYEHYPHKKWFIKLDDDSFIVYPRLLQHLSHFDWNEPHYMGKFHNNWGDIYCEGGAGYAYSIGMLNAMMPENAYELCMTEECTLPYEDLCTGRCIKIMFDGMLCENIRGMLQEARRDAKWYKMKNVFKEVISVHEVRTFTMMDVLDLLFYEQEWQNATQTVNNNAS